MHKNEFHADSWTRPVTVETFLATESGNALTISLSRKKHCGRQLPCNGWRHYKTRNRNQVLESRLELRFPFWFWQCFNEDLKQRVVKPSVQQFVERFVAKLSHWFYSNCTRALSLSLKSPFLLICYAAVEITWRYSRQTRCRFAGFDVNLLRKNNMFYMMWIHVFLAFELRVETNFKCMIFAVIRTT